MTGAALPSFRAAWRSDRGRVRPENEDACLVAPERGLFVLSDGMGGRAGGGVAARLVVGLLPGLLASRLPPPHAHPAGQEASTAALEGAIRWAVATVSAEVRQRGADNARLRGLGATVVSALFAGDTAHIAHLGDSRAYLLRQARLRRLTSDHTQVARLLQRGEIGVGDVATHPARHQLTRYVGMDGEARADVLSLSLAPGDRLLLCSDGLTDPLPDRLIAHLLRHQPDPDSASRVLVSAAGVAGGRDDASAIVVFVDALPPPPSGLPGAPGHRPA
jgi:PPM family protein phosphatase